MVLDPVRLQRVQELLRNIHHIAIATVNPDGSPHNTPVFAVFDNRLNAIWSSYPGSVHSENIARTHQVFITLFDSREGNGGLFMEADAVQLQTPAAVNQAYQLMKELKERTGGRIGERASYEAPNGQRLYQAAPLRLWTNQSQRDRRGAIIRDERIELPLTAL